MTIRTSLLAGLCALVLAPAAAHAQSAGDDQYSDPFGEEQPQAQAPSAPAAPAAPAAPSQAAPAQPAPSSDSAPAATQPAPAPVAAAGELPRTGGDAWLAAALGLALLSAGVALRARARRVT